MNVVRTKVLLDGIAEAVPAAFCFAMRCLPVGARASQLFVFHQNLNDEIRLLPNAAGIHVETA